MNEFDNKKAIIYYFSGTGNTKKAVRLFADKFISSGVDTELCQIDKDTKALSCPKSYDYIGIAYPIYGFNAPKIVIDFAKKLPIAAKCRLFVVKTSGEPISANDASSVLLARILQRKGYFIANEYHYVAPYNMIFRHDDYTAVEMYKVMSMLCPIDAEEVLRGEWHTINSRFFDRLLSFICRIEYPWFKHNGKSFKVDTNKCINCGKCIKDCPQKNIERINGNFVFGGNCVMCARCSFSCPQNAISIGLLNKWKVNGKYPTVGDYTPTGKKIKYCRKAYNRYFDAANAKIKRYCVDFNT